MIYTYGPLGSWHHYLAYLAFKNCKDFFEVDKLYYEQTEDRSDDIYQLRFRYFFTAAESLNNTIDYVFAQYREVLGMSDRKFSKQVMLNYPKLQALRDIVNPYKHAIRMTGSGTADTKLRWASDLQESSVETTPIESRGVVQIKFTLRVPLDEDVRTLEEAFGFWIDAHDTPTKFPLPDALPDRSIPDCESIEPRPQGD